MLRSIWRWSTLAQLIWLVATLWSFKLYCDAYVLIPVFAEPFLWLFAGMLVVTLVHEIGHAVAALACRWRVLAFAVYSIGLHLPSRTLAWLPWNRGRRLSGYVAPIPADPRYGTKRRWMWILAAGPGACFLLMAVALLAWGLWLPRFDTAMFVASNFGLALAITAASSALTSLVPHGRSDGRQLIEAARGDAVWTALRSSVWFQTALQYRLRLRDVPGWLVEAHRQLAQADPDGRRYAEAIEIGILFDRDPPDHARARILIDAFRARHGASAWLNACDAYLAAIVEGDADRAAALLWPDPVDPPERPIQLAAEAAVAAARGDARAVRTTLRAMRRAVRSASPFRDATFRDIERDIRAALDQRVRTISQPIRASG